MFLNHFYKYAILKSQGSITCFCAILNYSEILFLITTLPSTYNYRHGPLFSFRYKRQVLVAYNPCQG